MRIPKTQRGSALLSILILTTIAGIILASTLGMASSHILSTKLQKDRLTTYLEAEESLHLTLNWLRDNSTEFTAIADMAEVYSEFDFAAPAGGDNEVANAVEVPTRVFINGTNDAPILTNNPAIASSNFPMGTTKDLEADFAAADLGNALVRLTLVNMIAETPAKDYGDTDAGNPAPETNFYPIFRIDAMTALDQGAHVHGFVTGSLVQSGGVGFYGEDFVQMNQGCDSYDSSVGNYGGANQNANCGVGSAGPIELHQNEDVYGSLKTTDSIETSPPYGGDVCADFAGGCPNAGETCEGVSCTLPSLPEYDPWNTYCPADQGNVTINSNTTISVASDNAMDKCWNEIRVRPNKTLVLNTSAFGYFVKTFDIANNGTVEFQPATGTDVINIYVQKFTGDKFNGNQIFNVNNKPTQLKIHYLGTDDIVMNGTAAINAFMVAPYATVSIQGNFTYQGGIMAEGLDFSGNGTIHYDEAGDIQVLSNVTFRLKDFVQRYKL